MGLLLTDRGAHEILLVPKQGEWDSIVTSPELLAHDCTSSASHRERGFSCLKIK